MSVGTYERGRNNVAGRLLGGESRNTRPRAADDEVLFYERQVRIATRDARRRGLRNPYLAPEVLRAKSFLRYWRAVREQRG